MNEDDRMVACALMVRAKRTADRALWVGGAAVLLSLPPHFGVSLPFKVYALCAALPIAFGLAVVPGGLLALRTFSGQPDGVTEALRARGVATVGLQAGVGVALGIVALLSGALALIFMGVDVGA